MILSKSLRALLNLKQYYKEALVQLTANLHGAAIQMVPFNLLRGKPEQFF